MRIQNIANTNDGLQITYIEEADIHTDSGIMTARIVDIPHPSLPQDLLDELIEAAERIVDHARVVQRHPVESFVAPR
jgi:hypothetical protein